uniref:Tripartite motif-containing protein 2-like n=1 Tax=Saccoglossus kowalevskii TaxID=10224 RepID=A0ABM0N0S6_SACKO|nr:PREDICTED: tripartite motif-containing protein 2-like [Saccoglossus kowalevskii]
MGLLKVIGKEGTGEVEFKYPCGLAIGKEDGRLLIADSDNNRIQILDEELVFMKHMYFTQFKQKCSPFGVTSSNGKYFMTDRGNSQVIVSDYDGDVLGVFGNDRFKDPRGICVSPFDGQLYVADFEKDTIEIYTIEGVHVRSLSWECLGRGQLDGPCCLDIDEKGTLYVADHDNHCVQVFDSQYRHVHSIGGGGQYAGQLCYPKGVVVDTQGNVYVTDEKSMVQKFYGGTGELIRRLDIGNLNWPCGITLTADNRVVVADNSNHCIKVFSQ